MTRAGFIGLGSQGAGMAQRIMEMGVPMTLWARTPTSLEPFRGAALATDPAELGRMSDVVGICVTDGAAVREVTLGPTGVLAGMAAGERARYPLHDRHDECGELAREAGRGGVQVIDAPVSGGGAAAAAGSLTVYVGGTQAGVDRARPVLETYGNPVLHMGPLGSGLRTKLINNALNAAHFGLAHDAMATGKALGLDVGRLGEALKSGSGRSFSLEILVGLGSLDGIAGHMGPLLSKDIGLFRGETRPVAVVETQSLLDAADRFLAIVDLPRPGVSLMSGPTRVPRSSVDVRTRHRGQEPPVDPVGFWEDDWTRALEAHGERAVADAEFLGVGPLTIRIDHRGWTLGVRQGRLEVTAARPAARQVDLDQAAFTDLVLERKTAFGLAMAGRVAGDDQSVQLFCAWDAVLRSVLAGRYVYRPGEVVLRDPDGRPLDLNQEFQLGEATDEAAAAHFLAERVSCC